MAAAPAEGRGPRLHRTLLITLCTIQAIFSIDGTVTSVASVPIQRSLHLTEGQISWIFSAYALAYGAPLIFCGRLCDRFGRRRLFQAGLLTFGVASVAVGVDASPVMLVAARGTQGLAAALVAPAA